MRKKTTKPSLSKEIEDLKKRVWELECKVNFKDTLTLEIPEAPKKEEVVVNLRTGNYANLWFDGGMKHQLYGYGSYQISFNDDLREIVRLELPQAATSNQAELMTLNRALRDAFDSCPYGPDKTDLYVHGDSMLALYTSSGKWRAKHANVIPWAADNKKLLRGFASHCVEWISRDYMVDRFGH